MLRTSSPQAVALTVAATQVVKAIAIIGVVIIHIFSSLKQSPFLPGVSSQWWAVLIDQSARICVPLFVGISGYSLYQRYGGNTGWQWLASFFTRRVLRLLPWYIAWSLVFAWLFHPDYLWQATASQPNFIWQIILGKADYHLYFVPMIFQLYCIFPLLLWFVQKQPYWTVLVLVGIQLGWWWVFSYAGKQPVTWRFFEHDIEQYIWLCNWVGYFGIGMILSRVWQALSNKNWLLWLTTVALVASVVYATADAVTAINTGTDPLMALRFTRYSVFVVGVLSIVSIPFWVSRIQTPAILRVIGEWSYGIYLSHTLVLRLIFTSL